ncbi:hypothetical protein SAMN05216226_101217 [Halovenus aranensis]|uniref:Uncharacterized protein n=1 Tax=Halovenus aranensis TaxID=890420 RepID=A0A1G8S0C2_9EURY|nr:hypothetical protein [Halovenus aranensis]SDJ22612.1 hypothetical protein SAMN05216226_101217 [Halovenus aranensis]
MRFGHTISQFRLSDRLSLSVLGLGLVVLGVIATPMAVALPIGGTIATTGMLWGIDTLQSSTEPTESRVDCGPATEACSDGPGPCAADD